jgi:pyruvate formate lyase activating enzyme
MREAAAKAETSIYAKSPFEIRVNLGAGMPDVDVRSALAGGDMGFLHSFTTGSTVDGPGVRVVAWTTGCMWRCLYCHNPDTWNMSNGIPVPLARAVDELSKYRHGLKVMEGGFTLSGGEPLMQHRFAVRLLSAARDLGIHTALDTNGYWGHRLTDADLEAVNLVLLDIKGWNPERHRKLTGMDIGPTLDFAKTLADRGKPVWLRYVLVPQLTDNPNDIAELAGFAASLGNVERVDVLPFHQMGKFKWDQLGIQYQLGDIEPPSREVTEKVCTQFRQAGLKAY